jgi:hypothetical protein
MKNVPRPISLGGSQLGETRHVCAFFNNDRTNTEVYLPDGRFDADRMQWAWG